MVDTRIIGEPVAPVQERLGALAGTKPKVRILLYTDLVRLTGNNGFALGIMRQLILENQPFFVDFEIDLVDRHDGGHAKNKITPLLLANYEQVWFFGFMQANLPGQPENELTDPEVAALRPWMDAGGGVLITGDHSNPRPPEVDPALGDFLNLGRALGFRVPRASELRVWNNLPDSSIENSHNTHAPDPWGTDLNEVVPLDLDPYPQELILKRYQPKLRPHPLFSGRKGPITVFPDHMHEGQLLIPEELPTDTWPAGPWGQPKPEIVARGTDKRNGAVYGVVTAYDGAAAGVGRIVADSTWHHYFSLNLWGFEKDEPVLDRLAQYYVNLSLWLSPAKHRQEANGQLLWWLANHLSVRAVFGNPARVVGLTAAGLVREVANDGVLEQLAWPLPSVTELPEELVLGSILNEYYRELRGTDEVSVFTSADLVERGLRAAADEYASELRGALVTTEGLGAVIAEGLRF